MRTFKIKYRFIWLFVFIALSFLPVFSQQRLILVGGGDRSAEAVSRFVEWAGRDKSRILIVTWASGEPVESFNSLKEDFKNYRTESFENAPLAPLDAEKRTKFLEQLK